MICVIGRVVGLEKLCVQVFAEIQLRRSHYEKILNDFGLMLVTQRM